MVVTLLCEHGHPLSCCRSHSPVNTALPSPPLTLSRYCTHYCTHHKATLGEANHVEAIGELGVSLHDLGELVHLLLHGGDEGVEAIGDVDGDSIGAWVLLHHRLGQ